MTSRLSAHPEARRFGSLPGSREEVAFLASLFLEEGAVLLQGAEATEERLEAAVKGRRVVHLATHGFVRDDLLLGLRRARGEARWIGGLEEARLAYGHDPMVLSGLAFAGANTRATRLAGGDGILTALDASRLDLDGVDLVLLSACETARGRVEAGEGVVGLVQAFRLAGARQVVGSLWQVDDEATRALMSRFYEIWKPARADGADLVTALERAQAHVRAQPRWRHPHYWAAWVSWGLPD